MSTFSIEVKGFAADTWSQILYPPHEPHIDTEIIEQPGGDTYPAYILHSNEFGGCGSAAEALQTGVWLVRRLSAFIDMYFPGVEPVRIGDFVQEHDDKGKVERHSVPFMMVGRRRLPFIEHPNKGYPSPVQAALDKASRAPQNVTDAIEHFGAMPIIHRQFGHNDKLDNWYDLYKAYEALSKKSGIVNYGISTEQADRFNNQAQHFRHHKTTAPNPRMSLDEAKAIIVSALRHALSQVP